MEIILRPWSTYCRAPQSLVNMVPTFAQANVTSSVLLPPAYAYRLLFNNSVSGSRAPGKGVKESDPLAEG